MKTYSILLNSIIILLLVQVSQAQNAWQTLHLANAQMAQGNIDEAIAAYHRVLFFDTIRSNTFEACEKLAYCYVSNSDFTKAREFLKMAYNLTSSDSIRHELSLYTSSLYLLDGQYNYALVELYGMKNPEDDYFRKRKSFYLGIAFYQKEDFDESLNWFKACIDSNDAQTIEKLTQAFDDLKKYTKRYNPKTARTLSMIIPGTGQLVYGDFKGALNSFLLTGGLIFLFINTAAHYTFIDAGISVLPWFQRYYQGGYQNAEKIAIARKRKKIAGQYEKIITLIEKSSENP